MRFGIMGGTFDPIHRGHIHMALAAADELALAQVLLLPDKDPPHKVPTTAAIHRYRMAEIAAAADKRLVACDMEIKRPGRTYTVDTLEERKRLSPADTILYIIGSDTLLLFPTWKTPQRVAALCEMAVVAREGDAEASIHDAQAEMAERYGLTSHLLKTKGLPLSSAMIRRLYAQGREVEGFLPEGVPEYIKENNLYKGDRHHV